MSAGAKRPLAEAVAAAAEFRALFEGTYDRWEVAGSVRRGRPAVGDIEHVVTPRRGPMPVVAELFPGVARDVDLLLHRRDEISNAAGWPYNGAPGTSPESDKPLTPAKYPDGKHRWGQLYWGALFGGFRHEVFCATAENWGPILAIRTGPAELSQRLVTELARRGIYRQQDGYVRYARGKAAGAVFGCPEERTYFEICGVPWLEPHERD